MLNNIIKYLKSIDRKSLIIGAIVIIVFFTLKKSKENFEIGEVGKTNSELDDGDIIYIQDHKQRYLTLESDNKTVSFTDKRDEHSELIVVKDPKSGNLTFFNKKHGKYFNAKDDNTFNQASPKNGAEKYKEFVWDWSKYVLYNTDDGKVSIKTAIHKQDGKPAYISSDEDGKITYTGYSTPPSKKANPTHPNLWRYQFTIDVEYEAQPPVVIKEVVEKVVEKTPVVIKEVVEKVIEPVVKVTEVVKEVVAKAPVVVVKEEETIIPEKVVEEDEEDEGWFSWWYLIIPMIILGFLIYKKKLKFPKFISKILSKIRLPKFFKKSTKAVKIPSIEEIKKIIN